MAPVLIATNQVYADITGRGRRTLEMTRIRAPQKTRVFMIAVNRARRVAEGMLRRIASGTCRAAAGRLRKI